MGIISFQSIKTVLFISYIFFLFITIDTYAQEEFRIAYDNQLDGMNGFAEDHGLTVFHGGFHDAPTGMYSIGNLRIFIRRQYQPEPLRNLKYTNGELLGIHVKGGEVIAFSGNPVKINHPVLFRLVVAAEPNATVTIGLYDTENPVLTAYTSWEHKRDLNANSFFSDWKVLYVLFEAKSNMVQPVIQVASSDPTNRSATVLIDNLRIYEVPKDRGDFRVLLEQDNLPIDN